MILNLGCTLGVRVTWGVLKAPMTEPQVSPVTSEPLGFNTVNAP